MRTVYGLMKALQKQIHSKLGFEWKQAEHDPYPVLDIFEEYTPPEGHMRSREQNGAVFPMDHMLCHGESLLTMKERWDELINSFYDPKTDRFNPTKIPDAYDCIKYDVLHNQPFLQNLRPLYRGLKRLADFVIPHEYGVLRIERLAIGKIVCQRLLNRIVENLEEGLQVKPPTRCFMYFSSESHLHSLRNTLLLSGLCHNKTTATTLESIELNYLSHGVFRLFEDRSRDPSDPKRFYVNVQFSPGAALDPFIFSLPDCVLPVSRPVPVNGRVPFEDFKHKFLNCKLKYSSTL
jgi:inositol hexakisphosphate/diphosphoinositol-pentakisphosphate kinase